MTTVDAGGRTGGKATKGPHSQWAARVPRPLFAPLAEVGALAQLGGRVLWTAIRRPVGYWGIVRDELYRILKLCWFPMILAVFAFGMMIAILGINFIGLLGAASRYGQYFFIFNLREFTPWINSMVVAGIVGAAICSDLGARKVREELDALEVLGMDPVRELVLPRVLAATIMTPLLMLVSVIIGIVTGVLGVMSFGSVPAGDYFTALFANVTTVELAVALLKSTIIGFVIGIVCSYKGINSSGGAMGVGRAVNQAVVIAFALVFLVDLALNMISLGLFPQMQTVR
ncbi:ABC transporter permease [Amycolatopsis acidiphila]|uniref:ABC transporter permease n=1 Tax=Amycolatopsis acidiphila TaxID=715473 RepID=A0A558AIM7_9PSEU|nr:ABC transporter permease [Amycolatopsis acidiphila]TVT24120.1 ABC transporter permease [Amycolatopsis acidiphila]UIJ57719.1 ABC transporter permease [Amycolatopsis acidiphila]